MPRLPYKIVLSIRTLTDLGKSTTFDLSSMANYQSLTLDDFIICGVDQSYTIDNGTGNVYSSHANLSIVKSYNSSSGLLTAYMNLQCKLDLNSSQRTIQVPVQVYLLK